MNKNISILLSMFSVVVAITATAPSAFSAQPQQSFSASAQSYLDSFEDAYGKNARFHGAILLTKNGKILFNYDDSGLGQATYEIGSTTKMLLAVGLMQLVEQKKLSLTQPVKSILPDLPSRFDDVLIIHLMSHSSGISD